MSLDIELYTIEETPLDGFIPRIRAIDQLSPVANPSPAVTRSLSFLREYLAACQQFPDSFVYTSG